MKNAIFAALLIQVQKMKKIIVLLFAFLLAIQAYAQNSNTTFSQKRHFVEVSVGEPFSSLWCFNLQFMNNRAEDAIFHEWDYSNRPAMNVGYGDEYFVLPITVGYFYQLLDWLQIGGEISTMSDADVRKTWAGDRLAQFLQTNLYIAAGARFNYYHKNITDLYSGLLLGTNIRFLSSDADHLLHARGKFTWQVTALGVRFGKQIYGTVELGYGYKGIVSAGIGARF